MKYRSLVILSLLVALSTGLAGCGESEEPRQNEDNAQHDENDDNDDNDEDLEVYDPADEDRDTAIEFVVENGATVPFFVQVSSEDQSAPEWLTITHFGEDIVPTPNCMPRLCDEDKIPVCEEPQNEILEVEPQGEIAFGWDASNYQVTDEGCTERQVMTDEELEAEMCWGMDGDEEAQVIEDKDCGSSEINPPETSAGEVSITVN